MKRVSQNQVGLGPELLFTPFLPPKCINQPREVTSLWCLKAARPIEIADHLWH